MSEGLAKAIDSVLVELAHDPIAVLVANGIRGQRGRACGCPVARYFSARLGLQASVTYSSVKIRGVERKLPHRVHEAVVRIDRGQHPELIEGGNHA